MIHLSSPVTYTVMVTEADGGVLDHLLPLVTEREGARWGTLLPLGPLVQKEERVR